MNATLSNKSIWWTFGWLGLSLGLLPVLRQFPANTPLQALAGLWLTLVCFGSCLLSLGLGLKLFRRSPYRLAGALALASNALLIAWVLACVLARLISS